MLSSREARRPKAASSDCLEGMQPIFHVVVDDICPREEPKIKGGKIMGMQDWKEIFAISFCVASLLVTSDCMASGIWPFHEHFKRSVKRSPDIAKSE